MEIAAGINNYLVERNLKIVEVERSKHGFVYITTDDGDHPLYRYSELNRSLLLQHNLGNNEWQDIWLGEREKQLALF
ncbi:hypothetical protein R0H03_04125 [Pediococcus acidilactici]|uniref:Uncharacterized protein n=1 Tax=Pediococcus acidilactici TaxID=1254 RepID=A0AAW8YMD0_PEDAC|nr:hypothetical protein [Pediococcus acidilactici]MDV2911053.1 hypothetical protein [Pediococcus acidilactici]WQS17623.1 hypothetical protein SGW14_00880 [Pediococcus acidilactici]